MSIPNSLNRAMLDDSITGDDAHHQSHQNNNNNNYNNNAPIQIPPSPTLTNPDMILPVDENEREVSTPSPPFRLPSLSPLQALYWNQPQQHFANELSAEEDGGGGSGGDTNVGVAVPLSSGRPLRNGYSRHASSWAKPDFSRRLSDIGEEDSSSGGALSYTPSRGSQVVDGSGFSGRSSAVFSGPIVRASDERLQPADYTEFRDGTPGPVEEFPSAILSSEAERILENAKKRLTLMEGNLNRARSTMRLTPSISPTPSSSGSSSPLGFHQPAGGLYRSISTSNRRAPPVRTRYNSNSSVDANRRPHSRVHSETILPPYLTDPGQISRSVSAMGSDTSSFRHDDRSFRYEPSRPYLAWRSSPSGLQRTPENETQPASQESTPPLVLSPEPDDNNKRHINNVEVFNAAHPSQVPLTRTQSQLHVRDIQDQMKGLHIKISSLKVKAQEDNIRRRSFQSLRENSSPGLANPCDSPPRSPPVLTNSKSDWTSEHIREVADEDDEDEHAEEDDGMSVASNKPDSPTIGDPPQIAGAYPEESTGYSSGKSSAMGSIYEDAEEGEFDEADGSSASEADSEALDAILDEPFIEDGQYDEDAEEEEPYPSSGQQSDDSKPHEEREDAFDYEHFILHSALGNYANVTKTRRSSDSSTSSTATTRPAQNQSSSLDQGVVGRPRANSAASVSTVQSFATAVEGEEVEGEEEENDDDMESVLYWDRRFNDELGIQRDTPTGHDERDEQHNGARQQAHTQTIGPASTSLASSLVSTVKAASTTSHGDTKTKPSPVPAAATATAATTATETAAATNNKTLGINNDDTKLLEQLFQSLGKVCMDLQSITSLPDHDMKSARVLRRRLDAARRVLDGELDA